MPGDSQERRPGAVPLRRSRPRLLLGRATLAGLAAAGIYWVGESLLHTLVFDKAPFEDALTHGSANELWMRSFTAMLFVILGFVFQWQLVRRNTWEAQQRLLASGLAHAGDGIVLTDADGIIEYANPAFTRITGYAADELVGQKPSVLKSGASAPGVYEDMWATITSGQRWSGTLTDRRRDGTFYPAYLTISPVFDEAGAIVHFVSGMRDISDRVALQDRLRQAEKLESLGTLAGGIAHDFNNSLATLTLQADQLAAQLGAHPAGDTVARMQASLDAAGSMVQRLLTQARRGEAAAELAPLELRAWLDEFWPLLRLSVRQSVAMRLKLPPAPVWVRADAHALEHALLNLINNARDALPDEAGGAITAECTVEGDVVALRVSDTGPGVPEELRSRVFEPFFTTKTDGRGTGLGLAMVRDTVARHGGTVDLGEAPGGGAQVTVRLPVTQAAAQRTRDTGAEAPRGGGELVLLVDDQPNYRFTTRLLLESLGYRVVEASGGEEALRTFDERGAEIAAGVLDVLMPDMDGAELATLLLERNPGLPLLLVSGFDDGALARRDLAARVGLLRKPFHVDELARRLRGAIDQRPGTG